MGHQQLRRKSGESKEKQSESDWDQPISAHVIQALDLNEDT